MTVTELPDEDVLKYKCARDVRYVVEAYASDLQYGGNAATVYQAYKYYEGDTIKSIFTNKWRNTSRSCKTYSS